MSFDVSPEAYTRFMGRYSEPLAVLFADLARVHRGQRALDVGCGPGALTAELARRLGSDAVSAVEPSESFVAAVRRRCPGVDVRRTGAERLPFGEWWESFTHGVGPAGRYMASLADERQTALRERCRDKLPLPPFEVSAMAWTVTAPVS